MQTIKYKTDHKKIGISTTVQLTGKVVEIAGDKSEISTLTIEITEFEKI